MFDLINGLPVHALVVHVVVVLLPLLAGLTVLFVIRPKWRTELPWVVLGNAAVLAACFVATQSGEKLQGRLSGLTGQPVATWHEHLATVLPYFAIAQLAASVIAWLLVRRSSRDRPVAVPALAAAIVITLAAGGAATVWTYRVGDSGARAVWGDTIKSTKPAP